MLLGIDVGNCVRDIMRGKINIRKVTMIYDDSDVKCWEELLEINKVLWAKEGDLHLARRLCKELWNSGRVFTVNVPLYHGQVWYKDSEDFVSVQCSNGYRNSARKLFPGFIPAPTTVKVMRFQKVSG